MFSGRKLTNAWLMAVAIALSISGTSTIYAQSSGPTLMDRFSSFKNVFKRDGSSTRKSTSNSSRTRNGRPTYSSRSRSGATNSHSRSSSKFGLSNLLPSKLFGGDESPPERDFQPQQHAQHQQRTLAPARSPYGRRHSDPPTEPPIETAVIDDTPQSFPEPEMRTASRPRVGSAVASPTKRTQPRKSPKLDHHDNLTETLSELLDNEAVLSGEAGALTETDESSADDAVVSDRLVAEVEDADDPEVGLDDLTEDNPLTDDTLAEDDLAKTLEAVVDDQEIDDVSRDSNNDQQNTESVPIAVDEYVDDLADDATVAQTAPHATGSIDLHDALLSEELYDDLTPEEEAPEQVAEERFESIDVGEPDEYDDARGIEALIAGDRRRDGQQQQQSTDAAELQEPQQSLSELEEPIVARRKAQVAQVPGTRIARAGPDSRKPSVHHDKLPEEQLRPTTRASQSNQDVLVSTEQPVIVSHVEGPRSILVGREATYRVTLENTSNTPAQNLSAVVHVPEWAELVDVTSTSGVVQQGDASDAGLEWRLPELAARSSQTLRLRLIPESGQEFDLGVQWSQESAASHAKVVVREPRLEMTISGPQEVLFGTPQRYRLTLRNPGNGAAEGVAVSLIPPGSDASSATTHRIGTLAPSEIKQLELELTAREAGEMVLQATASANGGLETEVIKRVLCRKPELEIDWRGPDQKYAGTETAYYFRVRNPGTATTEPVEITARLPEGVSFVSASDSFAVDAATGVVTWRLPNLSPAEERFVQFHCQLDRPGQKEFEVTASTIDGNLADSTLVRTEVIALADLKLEVRDPRGARPIGEPVLYEIHVKNRGTTDARGIAIVGLFSEGIDPVSVEGAQNSVRDGRVTFQPVKSLPAGGEVLLRIRAVASQPGTHIFRAEVACDDLDIRLAAEEATRFFEDEFHWDEGETPYTAEKQNGARLR